jgi:hypothetical protein
MRIALWALACLFVMGVVAGCGVIPPKPPECKGEFRPVNVVEQKGASFDGTGRIVRCEDGGKHGFNG